MRFLKCKKCDMDILRDPEVAMCFFCTPRNATMDRLIAENAELKKRLALLEPNNWNTEAMAADLDEAERRYGAFGGWMSSQSTILHIRGYLIKEASHE